MKLVKQIDFLTGAVLFIMSCICIAQGRNQDGFHFLFTALVFWRLSVQEMKMRSYDRTIDITLKMVDQIYREKAREENMKQRDVSYKNWEEKVSQVKPLNDCDIK